MGHQTRKNQQQPPDSIDRASSPVPINLTAQPQPSDAIKVTVLVAPHRKPNPPSEKSIVTSPDRPTSIVRINVLVSPNHSRRRVLQPAPPLVSPDPNQAVWEEWEDDRDAIQIFVAPKPPLLHRSWVHALIFLGFWTTMAALVTSGGWLAVQLILNPGSVSWLGWLFPDGHVYSLSSGQAPRSLEDIRAGATQVGLSLGEPVGLEPNAGAVMPYSDLLIPVFAQGSCNAIASSSAPSCSYIAELRVYRPYPARQPLLQLIDRLAVTGPQEFFVVAPLSSDASDSVGSSRSLPLTRVDRIDGKSPTAHQIWLQLGGTWRQGSTQLAFGQVVSYDPTQSRLNLLTQWTSPAGIPAAWQEVTGDGTTELVVNQTVGLEPGFKVYQLTSSSQRQLQEVSLTQPALENSIYQDAIALAQSGLWSPALRLMKTVKAHSAWSAAAQAQMDVVSLHAQATQQQAERSWENPSQQILALLVDGRWSVALSELQTGLRKGHDATRLLQDTSGQVWRRVQTALRVDPTPEVQAWAMLVVGHQHDRATAIAWLQRHLKQIGVSETSVATNPFLQQTLAVLNTLPLPASQPSRLIGNVEEVAAPDLRQWHSLSSIPAASSSGQQWYRVRVALFHDGQRWQRSPFRLTVPGFDRAYYLWQLLGLTTDPQLQIVVWEDEPQLIQATVNAIQYREGTIELLARGEPIAPSIHENPLPPLAVTPAALHWLGDASLTLADLHQQQPSLTNAIITALQEETLLPTPLPAPLTEVSVMSAAIETEPPAPADQMTAVLSLVGEWTVQLSDLTGDRQPDAIVTLPDVTEAARTLIISAQGEVIYNNVDRPGETLTAIAELQESPTPIVLINDSQGYRIRQWSTEHQRFE